MPDRRINPLCPYVYGEECTRLCPNFDTHKKVLKEVARDNGWTQKRVKEDEKRITELDFNRQRKQGMRYDDDMIEGVFQCHKLRNLG